MRHHLISEINNSLVIYLPLTLIESNCIQQPFSHIVVLIFRNHIFPVGAFAEGTKNFAPFNSGRIEKQVQSHYPERLLWLERNFSNFSRHKNRLGKFH